MVESYGRFGPNSNQISLIPAKLSLLNHSQLSAMVNYKGSLVILGGQNKANETVTSAEEFIQGMRDLQTE